MTLPHTLGAWLINWISLYAPVRCRSLKTIERYGELAEYMFSGPSNELCVLGREPLSTLSHIDLEPALLSLIGAHGLRRIISARTVRHLAGLLNVALTKAVLLDLIAANPMGKVELPVPRYNTARSLDAEEIQIFREYCRKCTRKSTFPLIEVALATGCRRGELLALEWSDIDWARRCVIVSKSLEQTRAGLRIKNPKGEKTRVLSMPEAALVALAASRTGHRLIFCDPSGGYLWPDIVSSFMGRKFRKAGIPRASLHTLRHTHASHLLSRGVPLSAVSARLGHADTAITARIYAHALPADDQRASDTWDSLLSPA